LTTLLAKLVTVGWDYENMRHQNSIETSKNISVSEMDKVIPDYEPSEERNNLGVKSGMARVHQEPHLNSTVMTDAEV